MLQNFNVKARLPKIMCICAKGNPAPAGLGNLQQVYVKILAVRICVDFHGFVQFRGKIKNLSPFRLAAKVARAGAFLPLAVVGPERNAVPP